ncbi:hypothetical protein FisN_14Lh173 [Fistulifera solaris]|uniref:VASt domain-containing protein n=1 Tax=Fistulifera solaris TaxID=1519565 RepID=A0A1Z5J9K1_FISSO|nr:hypothetical protein FisN_14Lh173 [Fistulifera solaris]|eukprot:GAX10665.1 hypothetical protein FisN_14Lh173 [Fistulifera solaris]
MTRSITFTHPVKAMAMGLGPSEARTKRHQRLWRFDQGMLLENTTYIEGIPHADTFCICDRWLIAQSTSTSVQLSSSFEIQFTKRSLFRSLIEKSVKRETLEWWTGYTKMIQDVLSQGALEPLIPSDAMLWKESSLILERLDRQYVWTIRLFLFVIFLLFCILLLLVSLITVFANEIELLRAALEHKKMISPNCLIEEL